jgi:serine/threonine-protein kinase
MYEGFNDAALLLKIANDEPTPLRYMRPDIPPSIDLAVAGALTLSKTERYPSAEAFSDALAHAARQAGIVPADVRAMRAFVTPVVEGTISARRERLAKVYANRHGIRPAPPPPVAADGPVTMALPPPSVPPPRPSRPDAAPRPSSSSITATDTDRVSSPPELTAAETVNYGPVSGEQTATLGTGVELSDPRPSAAPPGSPARRFSQHPLVWVAAGAGLLFASVVVIVVVLRSGSTAAESAQGTEDGTLVIAPPAAAPSAAPEATASGAADASDIPVVDPSALPVAVDEPDAAKKHSGPWRYRAPVRPPPKEEPKPADPTPLGNPY